MTLEREIKDFVRTLGVDVVGLAGPGRFDGPPSLDPEYTMKGAKSIVSFAIPLDVPAIYDYLSKKTAIPYNIDLTRKYQKAMHVGLKLVKFLEGKGYRGKSTSGNSDYRRWSDPFAMHPKFSHRYGAYVAGLAAPGISGNAITAEYGASVILYTIVTDAELESDPILDPRYFFDGLCQKCMACRASCPPKMFMPDEEEYTLINGLLYPRGKKRDIKLCSISCAGLHSLSFDKKWSSWGKSWIKSWVGVEPDPEKQNIGFDLFRTFTITVDLRARLGPVFKIYSEPVEEGLFEDPERFPDYEDLPGESEGQKLRSYADVLEKVMGMQVADPVTMSCAQCMSVCSPTPEESLERWQMISQGGILCYKEGNEPVFTSDFEEAVALRKKYKYKFPFGVYREFLGQQIGNIVRYWGLDMLTIKNKKKYEKKLAMAVAGREKSHQLSASNVSSEPLLAD